MVHAWHYLGVIDANLPPTQRDANALDAYLAPHERDALARRERDARDAQRARDARRDAYANALAHTSLRDALAQRYVPPSATSSNAWRHTIPVHKPSRPTLGAKGAPEPNAWETQGPHARAHLAPDKACHHPLVRCSHKW